MCRLWAFLRSLCTYRIDSRVLVLTLSRLGQKDSVSKQKTHDKLLHTKASLIHPTNVP